MGRSTDETEQWIRDVFGRPPGGMVKQHQFGFCRTFFYMLFLELPFDIIPVTIFLTVGILITVFGMYLLDIQPPLDPISESVTWGAVIIGGLCTGAYYFYFRVRLAVGLYHVYRKIRMSIS